MERFGIWGMVVVASVLGGCAADETAESAANEDQVDDQQLVTSVNVDGTWTADASITAFKLSPPNDSYAVFTPKATFTGPTGKTRKMGLCGLMKYYASGSPVVCTSVTNCANAPTTLPTGGSRYCTSENGGATKYCYYRPGANTSYCAGSPANGGVAVSPGSYQKGFTYNRLTTWISYACFEGCAATDPSSSSPAITISGP